MQTACTDRTALSKYQALHNSVCFMCLVSRDAVGTNREKGYRKSRDQIQVRHNGNTVTVARSLNLEQILRDRSVREVKHCPPYCIGPVQEDLGVNTTDELGVFHIMEMQLPCSTGALVDVRTPDQYVAETIPGSLNLPYTSFHAQADSAELGTTLAQLGVTSCVRGDHTIPGASAIDASAEACKSIALDFSRAKDLVIWCCGPLGSLSHLAITGLLKLGYPAHKIRHYRGGLQLWKVFGLTTVVAEQTQIEPRLEARG